MTVICVKCGGPLERLEAPIGTSKYRCVNKECGIRLMIYPPMEEGGKDRVKRFISFHDPEVLYHGANSD